MLHDSQVTVQDSRTYLQRLSYAAAIVGTAALAYGMYAYTMEPKAFMKPKLGAGSSSLPESMMNSFMTGQVDTTQLLDGVSMLIWGLVVTKANAGLNAVNSKDSVSVGGFMKKTASLIGLIMVAATFKIASDYSMPAEIKSTTESAGSKLLAAAHDQLDPSSSHFKGGAHNAAIGNIVKRASSKVVQAEPYSFESVLEKVESISLTAAESTALLIGAMCVTLMVYYRAFASYHVALETSEDLMDQFNDPNALIVTGEDGDKYFTMVADHNLVSKVFASNSDDARLLSILEDMERPKYEAPVLSYHHALAAAQPQQATRDTYRVESVGNYYPAMSAPPVFAVVAPTPQVQTQTFSKNELMSMLLTEMAKEETKK